MADKRDSIICELFSCLSTLGDLRKQYGQAVSEGYIQLSKARYNLQGMSTIGPLQCPRNMVSSVGLEWIDEQFILISKTEKDVTTTDNLRQRNVKNIQGDEKNTLRKCDPICWFTALPPLSLRMSQQYFKQSMKMFEKLGIETVVALANIQSQINTLIKKLESLGFDESLSNNN